MIKSKTFGKKKEKNEESNRKNGKQVNRSSTDTDRRNYLIGYHQSNAYKRKNKVKNVKSYECRGRQKSMNKIIPKEKNTAK